MHHQHRGAGGDRADRRELLGRVVAQIGIEARVDADRAGEREQHGVAVGCAARGLARADIAAGAGPVLHQDLLPKRLAHALADQARHDVVAAARRERHHQRDRPRGISVGALRVRGEGR